MDDKVDILLEWACDYITKPFSNQELLARAQVQLRRRNENLTGWIIADEIVIDNFFHQVEIHDQLVALPRTEYVILKLLAQNKDQIIAKSVLLEKISMEPHTAQKVLWRHISVIFAQNSGHIRRKNILSLYGHWFPFPQFFINSTVFQPFCYLFS